MDDEKLIEAVARAIAICRPDPEWMSQFGRTPEQVVEEDWPEYVIEARAALAVIRPAVIEECARVAKTCHARNLSVGKHGEIELWRDDIHAAIRALAAPRVEQEKKP